MADQTFNSSYVINGAGGTTAGAVCLTCIGVGVNSGSVIDVVTPANTLTPDSAGNQPIGASSAYGGSYFSLAKNGTSSTYGYGLGTGPTFSNGSGTSNALFLVVDQIVAAANNTAILSAQNSTTQGSFTSIGLKSALGSGLQPSGYIGGSDKLDSGTNLTTGTPHTLCFVATFGHNWTFYIDGVVAAGPSADSGFGSSGQSLGRIGNITGQGAIAMRLFAFAFFSATSSTDVLNSTDVSNLHNSLTGSGNFALWTLSTSVQVPYMNYALPPLLAS